ncbi:MAG: hypothetical protein K5883_05275 [Pseudobutyrivibrio sp.]|nr:hypothetical protein [Pseudobutyrivibrio sp.]
MGVHTGIFRRTFIIIVFISVIVLIVVNKVENIYLTRAEEMGCNVTEIDKNNFFVEEGNTKFYYKKNFMWLKLIKYETEIPPNEEIDGGVVTATVKSKNIISVFLDENGYGTASFYCGIDFSDSMFAGNEFADPLWKRKESYEYITGNYMSQKQLTSTYERGMEILDNLKK